MKDWKRGEGDPFLEKREEEVKRLFLLLFKLSADYVTMET